MVPLTSASSPFHARVLAARLGADGIVTTVRGGLDGPYPVLGGIEVLVRADDLEVARVLLLADRVEEVFADDDGGDDSGPLVSAVHRWWLVAALLVISCCAACALGV
jgi:hypothetical protein